MHAREPENGGLIREVELLKVTAHRALKSDPIFWLDYDVKQKRVLAIHL